MREKDRQRGIVAKSVCEREREKVHPKAILKMEGKVAFEKNGGRGRKGHSRPNTTQTHSKNFFLKS